MGFFDNFPYTNFHDLNLDWIIKELNRLKEYVEQYTAINSVGYAGVWSITEQYPRWSIVTNGDNSYMSKKPVPAGININNEDYWLHMADLDPRIGSLIVEVKKRIVFVDTVSKLNTVENNNCLVYTSGYYEKMDGGGAYYLVKTQESENVDGVTVLALNNNKVAVLLPTSNALAFGISKEIDNSERFNIAIEHCSKNGGVLNFPSGDYKIGKGKYNIDSSKISIGGSGNTRLFSENVVGYVFTIVSPLNLDMYDRPRKPLHDISLIGNYFADNYTTNTAGAIQYGVAGNADATLVSPHIILENVVVRGFNIGFDFGCAYKSSLINCSVIECDKGVNVPTAGKAQAVPVNFVNFYAECCNYAIYAAGGGYNTLNFYGGAFEYNRSVFTTVSRLQFVNTRFEFDVRASCSKALEYRPVFNSVSSPQGIVKFSNCSFLALPEFYDNVKHWISDPYFINGKVTSSIFYGGCEMDFSDCDFGFDSTQIPDGSYIASGAGFISRGNITIGSVNSSNLFNPSQLKDDVNGVAVAK